MTSLRKRFEMGDFSEPFLAFWAAHKNSTPLCCYDMQLFDKRGRPLKSDDFDKFGKTKGVWKLQCDSSPYLEEKEFKKYCRNCQKEIEEILKKNGIFNNDK